LRALLDTSFLMLCAEVGRNLFSLVSDKLGEPIEPCTLPQVMAELRALTRAKGKRGRTAVVALEMAGRFRVIEPAVEGEVDEVLIATARREGCLLVTADLELFRKALEKGMRAAVVSERGEVRLVT
jgi:rRNA-processing protein FCF1